GSVANGQTEYQEQAGEWSGSQQRSGSGRVGNKSGRNRNRYRNTGYKIQGPMEKHTHQGPDCESGHSLNTTPAISFRCLANCRGESLIAESTHWPALVLQPTRQVSPPPLLASPFLTVGKKWPIRGRY
ncbi:unnamed protein product, partial [Staurois parvus]